MRLVILDSSDDVCEWAAKYVTKRIQDYQPGEEKSFYSKLLFIWAAKKIKFCFSLPKVFCARFANG